MDAWATIDDVLTFYQERIANEGFLRTATERRSILEQARLIGYELNPGVAASAYLAFGVDTAAGAPTSAVIAKGTKVQSVPGQNELPQTFETSDDITARVEWNALTPRQMRPQELAISGSTLYLLGLSVGLDESAIALDVAETHPLDTASVLPTAGTVQGREVNALYVAGTTTNLKSGDVILLVGRQASGTTTRTLVRTVLRVTEENDLNRTKVEFDAPTPPSTGYAPAGPSRAQVSIRRMALDSQSVDQQIVGQTWANNQLTAWLTAQGWSANNALGYIFGAHNYPEPKTQLPPGAPGAFALRTRLGFFGHNAPAYASLTDAVKAAFYPWDSGLSIWRRSLKPAAPPNEAPYYEDADCFLERSVAGLTSNSWVVLELPTKQFTVFRLPAAAESSQAGFSLSAKTTGLKLAAADTGTSLGDSTTDKNDGFTVRKTTAHVLSDRLVLVQLPIEAPLGRGTPEQDRVTLDRMVLNLSTAQPLVVTGERADLPGVKASEIVILDTIQHSGGFTTLFFASPGLRFRYVRKTVTINANVARATHGDTVTEVLGSGDAARPNQAFVLKRPSLTYTPSADPSGARSSLAVRVNRVLWSASPHLYGLDDKSETYIVRHDDDGKATVVFGDGAQGARLPTGAGNVIATYRSGIGLAGMVGADKLTLLMTRPLGIRGVTNPLPASGAADPESLDGARTNAPLTVLAMGRIVSLQDAEDFARAFAGIGKARAIALWRGGVEWIHLTVASEAAVPSQDGTVTALSDHRVDATSPTRQNLVGAIEQFKEPSLRIRVDTYQPVFFDLAAKVLADARYLRADVEAAITAALIDAFAFERRAFGQVVTRAEVVRVIQSVAGVVFVDVEALHRFDASPGPAPEDLLIPGAVQWGDGQPEPSALAELLVINPLGITLTLLPPEAAR